MESNKNLEPLVRWFMRWPSAYLMSSRPLHLREIILACPSLAPAAVVLEDLRSFLAGDRSINPKQRGDIVFELGKGSPKGAYSCDDFFKAAKLAVELPSSAVYVYDKPDSAALLEKRHPGFSRELYEQILGTMSYLNR